MITQDTAFPTAEARIAAYRMQLRENQSSLQAATARSRTIGRLRLAVFALLVAASVYALAHQANSALWSAPAIFFVLFTVLVRVHANVRERLRFTAAVAQLYESRIAAAAGNWDALPHVAAVTEDMPHWATELDVVGELSLLRLLAASSTVVGRRAIESWLLTPATVDEIAHRAESVKELAARIDIVDALQTQALMAPPWPVRTLRPFIEWTEIRDATTGFDPAVTWARLVTASVAIAMLLYGAGIIAASLLVTVLMISATTAGLLGWRATKAIAAVQGTESPLESFSTMMRVIEETSLTSPKIAELRQRLHGEGIKASTALAELRRILALAEIRSSPMMHVLLQLACLWDIHLLARLKRWRNLHGRHSAEWLQALGEAEALCSLAVLSHSNPDWCFPGVVVPEDGAAAPEAHQARNRISAMAVAHPLIARGVRVGNDVTVGPPGSFLLVTGSNMSGKSTLLRTLGVNIVLAQMGAPVCATSFATPAVILATSVQVQDSLAQGVSRFMAEVLRLRDVVNLVAVTTEPGAPLPLYLLDEILQGTNSAERQAGARMVISRLLRSRCIGVVTTHDLALADSPELSAASHKVHFSEGVEEHDGNVILSFDYQLCDGIATSVNALKLMRAVGLTS